MKNMTQLQYRSSKSDYIGEWSDGRQFTVDESAVAECIQEGINGYVREDAGKEGRTLTDQELQDEIETIFQGDRARYESIREKAEQFALDPVNWSDDMDGVTVEE